MSMLIAKWEFVLLHQSRHILPQKMGLCSPCFSERMTARECVEHAWLHRKQPFSPPPEPKTPVPKTPGLDMTKDNLRVFVERWSEHPNSPYLFDVSCHMISPLLTSEIQMASSHHSLRGMSPSPCGSLASSTESIPDFELSTSPDDNVFQDYTFELEPKRKLSEDLQFERRASDSSCFVKKADIADRVNLAEEIRKLSDKLFKMSAMPDFAIPSFSDNSNTKLSSNIPNVDKLEDISVPWRRKFKLTEKNRDIPLSAFKTTVIKQEYTDQNGTLKNTEKWSSVNGTNALGTKDLLLKLLDKWDDTQDEPRTTNGRHKSISAEWSEVESLGQKTISSLNSFFQSRTTMKKTNPFLAADGVK